MFGGFERLTIAHNLVARFALNMAEFGIEVSRAVPVPQS